MSGPEEQWRPGAVVGEYRLLRRLGAGGMGAVDLAEHLPTGAQRAIKSIAAPLDPDLLRRFQREAEVLARVAGHPNVARVHSAGVALGRPYLVLDHLTGGDLQQRLRGGPLPAREVARLGVALASGLAHLHARGVLHRDLKPANVLFDEQARPVLVDFGLALPTDARSLTATGESLGTPAFMAPEQALGDKAAIGPRTDVYGLGALLYAALTGRPPAEGKSPIDVMRRVVEQAPPAPHTLVPGVPPRLEQALMRALAKRPEQRFASVEELGAALASSLEVGAGRTIPPTVAVALVGLASAVAVAAVAAVGSAPARVAVERPAPVTTATPPRPPLESPRAVDRAPPVPVDDRPTTVGEIDAPPAHAEDLLPAESRDAALLGAIGVAEALWLHGATRRLPGDAECYRVAVQLFNQVAVAGGGDVAVAWSGLGRAFDHGLGVRQDKLEARRCFEAAAERGDVRSLVSLANSLRTGVPGAPRDLRRSRDVLLKGLAGAPSDSDPDTASMRFTLVTIALEDEALVSLEAASAQVERVPPELVDASRRELRARLFMKLGRLDDAVQECALALDDAACGGQVAIYRLQLLVAAGRSEEAARARADLERRAPGQAGCAIALARLLVGEGKLAEARELYLSVAEAPDDGLWHRRAAREELFRLCLRADAPHAPVTLTRARELLLLEPDGAALVEEASR